MSSYPTFAKPDLVAPPSSTSLLTHPDIITFLHERYPFSSYRDLGGTTTFNVLIEPEDFVLRVHRRWTSRRRVMDLQSIRRLCAEQGNFVVPRTIPVRRKLARKLGTHIIEMEQYLDVPHPPSIPAEYRWLFGELGRMQSVLSAYDGRIASSMAPTWATPRSLKRWIKAATPMLRERDGGDELADRLTRIVREIGKRWVAPTRLPQQIVLSDFHFGNVRRDADGRTVVLDFGLADRRPRVWGVATSLAIQQLESAERHRITAVDELLSAYDESSQSPLARKEVSAIPAMSATSLVLTTAWQDAASPLMTTPAHQAALLDSAEFFLGME